MKLEEKWYEGDFKKKYPNGVLCWVWHYMSPEKYRTIVVNYVKDSKYPFLSFDNFTWKCAKPMNSSEAPAIIGGKDA